jgi:hypothetical protein
MKLSHQLLTMKTNQKPADSIELPTIFVNVTTCAKCHSDETRQLPQSGKDYCGNCGFVKTVSNTQHYAINQQGDN